MGYFLSRKISGFHIKVEIEPLRNRMESGVHADELLSALPPLAKARVSISAL